MRLFANFHRKSIPPLAVLVVLVWCLGLFAGTTGKISGRVTDAQTREGLPGVAVMIEGTKIGAATDFDGNYVILNVAPGVYRLSASTVGYTKMLVTNIEVNIDKTTTINFRLSSEAIEMETVEVVAEKPVIEAKVTQNDRSIGASTIENLPVIDVQDILATEVGFVSRGDQLHVRGGRAGEVKFQIDGVDVNDPLGVNAPRTQDPRIEDSSGQRQQLQQPPHISMNVASSNIEEINIIKSGFSAEYGNVQSAVVNLVTKEGSNQRTSGRIEYYTDDLGFPSLNKYSFNSDRLDWNLSGPVPLISDVLLPTMGLEWPGERMSYYLSFTVDKTDTYTPYSKYCTPTTRKNFGYNRQMWDWFGIKVPNRQNNYYNALAKVTYSFRPNMKFDFKYSKEWEENTPWDWDFRYTPSTAPHYTQDGEVYQLTFKHTPGWLKNTFYQVLVSKYVIESEHKPGGLVPGDFLFFDEWEIYTDQNNNGQWDPAEPYVDANGNGQYDFGEPYSDKNGNGYWDEAEPLVQDTNGNGVFDPERESVYEPDDPEPYLDGDRSVGEPFEDVNRNGVYDEAVDIFSFADDLNGNGSYDGPNDPWSPGIPFEDLNGNGVYDAPNLQYDLGEPFVDLNGNGRWDPRDLFFDFGFDRRMTYTHKRSRIWTLKFDITGQLTPENEIKSGFEYKWNNVRMEDLRYPFSYYGGVPDTTELWPDKGTFRDFYTRTPSQGAVYLQNNILYGAMVANVGLRYDFFRQAPEIWDVSEEEAQYQFGSIDSVTEGQNKFSPRLGVSYPITDRAKIYFNYGHFYQLPELYQFYARATQTFGRALPIVGNVNLNYTKTIAYEIGVAYQVGNNYKLDISGFYKDYYGLINAVEGFGTTVFQPDMYGNNDYARTRGFEVELTKSYGQYLTGSLDYEYSWAFGKSSTDIADYYLRANNQEIPIQEFPLDWDIRHQLTINTDLRVRKGDHPRLGPLKIPDNWGLNLLWQLKSGFPYTPGERHPEVVLVGRASPPPNSKRMPASSNMDLRFNKDFGALGFNYSFIVWVTNVFDTRNVFTVHTDTGRPDTRMLSGDGLIITGLEHDANPTNWGPGRNIKVGLSMSF